MARIRTIKPEFWVDEKVTELSPWARLQFIGLWNFADDSGRMEYNPKRLKLQVFPSDKVECDKLMGELVNQNLVHVYDVEGKRYLQVVGFAKHQKIDKRTASRHPSPPTSADFPRFPPNPADGREKEGIDDVASSRDDAPAFEVLEYLNKRSNKSFRPVDANLKPILARLQEGATVDDCKAVIDAKVSQWAEDAKMREYLRPKTLFNPSNFQQYLGSLGTQQTQEVTWE